MPQLPASRLSSLPMNLRVPPSALLAFSLALFSMNVGQTTALAADGVYYLKVAVSVTTDSGIHSELAGTKVTKVGTAPGGLKVKFGDGQVANVPMQQLTTDPLEAGQLAQQEAARKAATNAQIQAASSAQAAEDVAARQRADALALQLGQLIGGTTPASTTTSSSPSGLTGSALDDKGSGTARVNPPKKREPIKKSGKKRK